MKWISVKDRLPTEPGEYIVFNDCEQKPDSLGIVRAVYNPSRIEFGYWGLNNNYDHFEIHLGIKADKVTHWMPLPEKPE